MKKFLKMALITILGLSFFTGCRTAAINNVVDKSINLKDETTDDQAFKAIKIAGIGLGWKIRKVKPGLAEGQLDLRDHQAIVQIPYNNKSYSIIYKSSTNLKYDASDNTIHSNYNAWIQNLTKEIDLQLINLE